MTTPEPPPEAQLIKQLREDHLPHLSMREAARRAGFSVATWTQIEQGYRKITPALTIPIKGTDEKIARMARVVGATPGQLAGAGREDAATALGKLLAAGPDPVAELAESVRQARDLTDAQKNALIEAIYRNAR